MPAPVYDVGRLVEPPELACRWEGPSWGGVSTLDVAHFHPRSSDHRPVTRAKIQRGPDSLHVLWRVEDRYVRSVQTDYDSDTYTDSCVELFVRPGGEGGYFALEVNAGGAFSLRFIEDWTRTANRFAKWTAVPARAASRVRVAHTLPAVVNPEVAEPVTWLVEVALPLDLLESYCGPIGPRDEPAWRANLFKCGDRTSHPHWASWAPIGEALNFHQPQYFGTLRFDRP